MRRLLALLLVLAAAAGVGYIFFGLDDGDDAGSGSVSPVVSDQNATPESQPEADIVADSIELTQGRAGRIMWSLKADTGRYHETDGLIDLEEPRITYFLGKDREEVRLGSRAGTVYQQQDRVVLSERVSGAYDAFDIKANRLDYEGEGGELILSGAVSLKRFGLDLDADQAVIHLLNKTMTATGNVTAVIRRDELASEPTPPAFAPAGEPGGSGQ
jgi:LPS export ABC transporter protein LptC